MTQAGDSCRHPGDSEGCIASLTRAWEAKALAPHCMLDGLASGDSQWVWDNKLNGITGGYIPFGDHFIPPEVGFEQFGYYRRKLNQMIDD